jgi:hypothetical protein
MANYDGENLADVDPESGAAAASDGENLADVDPESGAAAASDGESFTDAGGGGTVVVPVPSGIDGGL